MSRSQSLLIELITTSLLVWTLLRVVERFLGTTVLGMVVGIAVLLTVTTWMLKYQRSLLAGVYRYPGVRHWIDVICRFTKFQPPVESPPALPAEPRPDLLLFDLPSFRLAEEKLRAVICGHDEQISQLLARLQNSILLRNRTGQHAGHPPLGIYLFAGPDGIGKRYLARKLGNLLYRRQRVLDVDLATVGGSEADAATLFGSSSTDGAVTSAVRSCPCQLVILQNVERAATTVLDILRDIFATGQFHDPFTKSPVHFEQCIFVLTTTAGVRTLTTVRDKTEGRRNWNSRAHEVLASETPLTMPFLATVHDVLLFDPLLPIEKAAAIALLMRKECRKYGLGLHYVEPELLADEVQAVTEDFGLSTFPARVARLMHDPLVRASRDGLTTLVLRQNQITLVDPALQR